MSDIKTNNVWLMKGDCLARMKEIPDGSVDAIIADIPYGTTSCKWDSIIPLEAMWEQLERIIKPNGAIVLFGSEPFSSALRVSNLGKYKYDIVWKKEKPTNFFQLKRRIGKVTENVMLFYEGQCAYNPQMVKAKKLVTNSPKGSHNSIVAGNSGSKVTAYKDTGYRYPVDVLEINREKLGSNVHPTQKPVALMEYLIKTYTNENETVLDFTFGSGTTGVAAINTNRKFIGIEMDSTYFDIGSKRILEANKDE